MEKIMVTCPQCACPFEIANLVTTIYFPDDIKETFDLIENNLNKVSCPLCKFEYIVAVDLIIFSLSDKKAIAVIYDESHKEEILVAVKGKLAVSFFDNYESAVDEIVKWLNNDLAILLKRVNDNKDKHKLLTSMQARLLFSLSNEKYPLSLRIQSPTDEINKKDILKDIYTKTVSEMVVALLSKTYAEKAILDFPNRLQALLQVSCVNDDLLNSFIRYCETVNEKQVSNLVDAMAAWNIHYTNAILHSLVSRKNPQKDEFAWIIRNLWEINAIEPGLGTKNQYLLLDKQLASSLLTFEAFFNVHIPKLEEALKTNQLNLIEEIRKTMNFYGWEELFLKTLSERVIIRTTKTPNEEQREKLVEIMYNRLSGMLTSAEKYDAEDVGIKVAASVQTFLHEQFDAPSAAAFIGKSLEVVDWEKNMKAGLWICVECVKVLNRYGRFDKSEELITIFSNRFSSIKNDEPVSDNLLFNFFIEAGNVFRYTDRYKKALEMYDAAEDLLHEREIYKDERQTEAELLLKRNKAIVYRQLGEFALSLKLLRQVQEKLPQDFEIALNIHNLYMQANLILTALEILEPYYNRDKLGPKDFRRCGLAIIASYGLLEKYQEAKAIIINVYKDWHTMNLFEKGQLVNTCLLVEGNNLDFLLPEVDIKKLALEIIDSAGDHIQNSLYLSTLSYLLRKYLYQNNIDDARRLFHHYGHLLVKLSSASWEYYFVLVLYYYYIEDYDLTKNFIQKLIDELNESTPKGENKGFVIRWLQNKGSEQKKLLSIACDLFDKGCISEMEVLELVEFSSGREITARLLTEDVFPYSQTLMLDLTHSNPNSAFFIFFDVGEGVRFIHISIPLQKITIEKTIYKYQHLEELRTKTITSLNNANPTMLEYTDRQLSVFVELTLELGIVINKYLDHTIEELYFIAGRSLANLPLHLIKFSDDQYIIEKYPVCYINNLATLSLLSKIVIEQRRKKAMITAVTKEGDKEIYVKNIRSGVETIKENLEELNFDTTILYQSKASKKMVVQEMKDMDEAVFLCHGFVGNDEDGGGICLAYNNTHPPGINDAVVLKDFLLTWHDIEPVLRTPSVFISAACSSAILKFGSGGVNFGLEQSLFANGTKVIISPLWNVHQESALFWIKEFFQSRINNPKFKLSSHYQYACLKTKETYPHFYFWAPFIIKGINNY